MSKSAEKMLKKVGDNISASLGRGVRETLEAKKGSKIEAKEAAAGRYEGRTKHREAGHLDISKIAPDPAQPRKHFDKTAIERLAKSLERHGQIQPIRVRFSEELGKWVILAGERRYQAAKLAGRKSLACIFVEKELSESERLEEQLIENCQREDLTPLEHARAYQQLLDLNGWTAQQLVAKLHLSNATVSRALALLKLPEDIQELVESKRVPPSAASELVRLKSDEERRELANRIASGELNREETTAAVQAKAGKRRSKRPAKQGRLVFEPESGGPKVTVSAPPEAMSVDALVETLEKLLKRARKARKEGVSVEDLAMQLSSARPRKGHR